MCIHKSHEAAWLFARPLFCNNQQTPPSRLMHPRHQVLLDTCDLPVSSSHQKLAIWEKTVGIFRTKSATLSMKKFKANRDAEGSEPSFIDISPTKGHIVDGSARDDRECNPNIIAAL